MKKSLLILVMVLMGTAGYAQRLGSADDGLDIVVLSMELDGPAMASMEMKQELSLTEEQYLMVDKLNKSRYQQLQQVEASFAHDALSRAREFRSVQRQNDENLRSVLTAQQLLKYQKLEGRLDAHLITEHEE
ncbi:hypothetical protein [Pontibacter chinhatensis]|nr:hypothetical protein [Pontibacter chinhatensis]